MIAELSEQERDQMAHAIGHHSAKGCSVNGGRNYVVAASADPVWRGLVERGFAVERSSSIIPPDESVFIVTEEGRQALEADPRSQRVGKEWAVKFRQFDAPKYVWAETRGKAKYAAIADILDCFPDGAGQAFKSITSCRLAR